MTIEQKAEEYAKECFPNDEFKQAMVEDGCLKFYKQGQQDKHQTVCDGCVDLGMLQKENAELKDLLEKKIKEKLVLENDNENLKQENEKLNEQAIFGRERAKKIIIEFFKWYSENKDGEDAGKYADSFLSEYFEHSANAMNQYEEWYGDR